MSEPIVNLPEQNPILDQGDYIAVPRGVLQGMLNEATGLREQVTSLGEQVTRLEQTLGTLLLTGANAEPPTAANVSPTSIQRYEIVPAILPTKEDAEVRTGHEAHTARDSLKQTLDDAINALYISAKSALDHAEPTPAKPAKRLLRSDQVNLLTKDKTWGVTYGGNNYCFSARYTQQDGEEKQVRHFGVSKTDLNKNYLAISLDVPHPNVRRLALKWNFDWSKVGHVSEMEEMIRSLLPDTSTTPEGAKLFESLRKKHSNLIVNFTPHDDDGVGISLDAPQSTAKKQSFSYNLQRQCFQSIGDNPYGNTYYDSDISAESAKQLVAMAYGIVPSL